MVFPGPGDISCKAKKYSTIKYCLAIGQTIYTLALLLLFQGSGLAKTLAAFLKGILVNNLAVTALYILILYGAYSLFILPLNLFQSFILERKFSLSKQSLRDWLIDQLKVGMISYIIGLLFIWAFYFILKHKPNNWWIFISLFWVFLSVILAKLTPLAIIPLFFKYKPLSDASLKARIIALADKMQVRIIDVFEIDFSKKTLKANAGFMGIGKTKRVILADTLKDKYSQDEIEVILAHEFAHYRLKHLFKLILSSVLGTTVSFYLIFKTSGYFFKVAGISSLSDIAGLPIVFIYFMLFGIVTLPLENYISRRLEINADMLALKVTGLKAAFISTMEKLSFQNLADRDPHPLIKFFFFDHPTIEERIFLAKKF